MPTQVTGLKEGIFWAVKHKKSSRLQGVEKSGGTQTSQKQHFTLEGNRATSRRYLRKV